MILLLKFILTFIVLNFLKINRLKIGSGKQPLFNRIISKILIPARDLIKVVSSKNSIVMPEHALALIIYLSIAIYTYSYTQTYISLSLLTLIFFLFINFFIAMLLHTIEHRTLQLDYFLKNIVLKLLYLIILTVCLFLHGIEYSYYATSVDILICCFIIKIFLELYNSYKIQLKLFSFISISFLFINTFLTKLGFTIFENNYLDVLFISALVYFINEQMHYLKINTKNREQFESTMNSTFYPTVFIIILKGSIWM